MKLQNITIQNKILHGIINMVLCVIISCAATTTYGQASQLTPIGTTIGATNTDDGNSQVDLTSVFPYGINFGGTTYTTMYIGTNGYVTFGSGYTGYNPSGIAGWNTGDPIIAAQYDDLDPGDGGDIYYNQNTGSDYVVATYVAVYPFSTPVGYGTASTGTSFQIVLRKPADYSSTNLSFQLEVRYQNIGWHTSGNISSPPTAGWSTGDQTSYAQMPYSGSTSFQLNQSNSNVGQTGIYQWDVIGGSVLAAPTVNSTTSATSITGTSAESGGNISSDGGASITASGVVWSTSSMPSLSSHAGGSFSTDGGTSTGTFTSSITGLTPATTYYIRAYATNNEGTGYGPEESFTTLSNVPPVANNDSYTRFYTNTGVNFIISAPGVLSNDDDDDGDGLTVGQPRPASGVSNGSLTLNENGSFTYTSNNGFRDDSDSFTYFANDGTVNSTGTATVTLNVVTPWFVGPGNDFNDGNNWNTGYAPTESGLDIIIADGQHINFSQSYTCGNLTFESATSSFSCTSPHTLTITGNVIDGNGRVAIEVSSSLEVSSSIEIAQPAVLPE